MEGYKLFRKDRKRRQERGVVLYVREQLECMELCVGIEEELMENLCVRIKERTDKEEHIVRVYYRPPDQEEQVDEPSMD